jgi:hypothetical protein
MVGGFVVGLLLFAVVVLLSLTLAQLRDSGGHIEAQDKKIAALFELGRPLTARADDFADQVGPALEDGRSLIGPLIDSNSGGDLADVLDSFPALDSSLRRLTAEAIPVLAQTDPGLLLNILASVGTLTAELNENDRLIRLVDGVSAALVDVSDRDLVRRLAKTANRIRKVLEVQRQTRSLQEHSLRVQIESLGVQKRTLDHVRSLDQKTLGETPPLP